MKRIIMCKLQEPTVQQLQQVRMSKPQSSQLIYTIFGSSDEESLTTPEQAKMQQLENDGTSSTNSRKQQTSQRQENQENSEP